MTDDLAFLSLIQKNDDGDFLKSAAEAALQRIMDYDVENLIGAAPHQRSPVPSGGRSRVFGSSRLHTDPCGASGHARSRTRAW